MASVPPEVPFTGANALIFGGAKGIGKGVALEWARRGARVAIADFAQAAAEETVAEIEALGGKACAVVADVTSDDSMISAVDAAERALGEFDIVMNNVGAALTGHPQDIPFSEWRRITELNYFGTLRAIEIFVPKMLARGRGHIVNTASFAGLYPYAISRIPYAAAKAAVIALSENLAIYLEPQGVRVTCFMPGPVKTNMLAGHTPWSEDCMVVGPGSEFDMLSTAEAAVTLSDAMCDGRILVPTHANVWETVGRWAESPDDFIRAKIHGYANGDHGRSRPTGVK
jgi:NAD(P)-dependent dehydrogenase (short-subunit alcohol dehydrogenase family)